MTYCSGIIRAYVAVKRNKTRKGGPPARGRRRAAWSEVKANMSKKLLFHFRRLVISTLAVIALTTLLWPVYIDYAYAYEMPTSPQPSQGRNYRLVVSHGSVVFVNGNELHRAEFAFNRIFLIGIISGGLLGICLVYWK